jgi:hypothetical protein
MSVGSEYTLTATIFPSNASNKKISWKSGNSDIVKVDNNGTVTAIGVGKTTVSVTSEDGAKTAKCDITVTMKIPDMVNLGLPSGVKWASCNLGATSETDYGYYYAWGETTPKDTYTWSNYLWCGGSDTSLKKYNNKSANGQVDNKTVLDASDDAATANLGNKWRMPTKADFEELKSQCTWTWTTVNNVWGYRITGKGSASIFLPAAGNWSGSNTTGKTHYNQYWTSSLNTDFPECAFGLDSDDGSGLQVTYYSRSKGMPVRAVSK